MGRNTSAENLQALLLSNCTLRYLVSMAAAHMTCYQHFISKTSMANAVRSKSGLALSVSGPGALSVGARRSFFGARRSLSGSSGPLLCVGPRRSGALCRRLCGGPLPTLSVSPRLFLCLCVRPRRPLSGSVSRRGGPLPTFSVSGSCAICRGRAVFSQRSLCRAPAVSVSGPRAPGGLCVRPKSSLCRGRRSLCRGRALSVSGPGAPRRSCVRARRSLCRGAAICVGARRSLCQAPAVSVLGPGALRVHQDSRHFPQRLGEHHLRRYVEGVKGNKNQKRSGRKPSSPGLLDDWAVVEPRRSCRLRETWAEASFGCSFQPKILKQNGVCSQHKKFQPIP